MTRLSDRTVQRTLQSLEEGGWVEIKRGVGRGKVSSYTIRVDVLKRRQRDTLLEKGDIDAEKVTLTPVKGDIDAKPPHPLIGVNVSETSLKQTSEKTLVESPDSTPSLALFPEDQKQIPPTPSQLAARVRDRLFLYYCDETGRDPKYYTLTDDRLKKGVARLRECLAKTEGDLKAAEELFLDAIDGLAGDDYLMGRDPKRKGQKHCEWVANLCKSQDEFEKQLAKAMVAA